MDCQSMHEHGPECLSYEARIAAFYANAYAFRSESWAHCYVSALNADCSKARAHLRRLRAERSPMKIAIDVWDERDLSSYQGAIEHGYTVLAHMEPEESCTVYGWRAALVAIRAMGADREARTTRYARRKVAIASDPVIADLLDRVL